MYPTYPVPSTWSFTATGNFDSAADPDAYVDQILATNFANLQTTPPLINIQVATQDGNPSVVTVTGQFNTDDHSIAPRMEGAIQTAMQLTPGDVSIYNVNVTVVAPG